MWQAIKQIHYTYTYINILNHKIKQQSKTRCKYRNRILNGRHKIYYVTQGYQKSLASKNLTIHKLGLICLINRIKPIFIDQVTRNVTEKIAW